ncbi:DUF3500 domain-containing protein [Hymenobacter sp. HMF4947]|uniref:DUF3500 domain-containing protein n=1 Tax=Hymenobacter ginkgonis TaxID=2682976 RepID=A0A7K1TGE9_9BACT|nr:DUF3500 domain-containing protein [Hymenobacter ginkgonis]MVN77485.1 DUF3500 domain-containing protein [Hymenobacter ginkgonis]
MQNHLKTLVTVLVVSAATFFTACKKDDTTTGSTTSNTNSNPDPIAVSTCASATGIAKVLCLADAFKSQLEASQITTLQTTYSVANAKKWSNLPQGLVQGTNKRIGLSFGAMTTVQVQYAKALIKEISGTTANEGWDEIQQLLNADEYLGANGGGSTYGAANYYIAFLGTPATTGTFEIQFGGHHLACASTYKDGVLVGATPAFRGVEPFATFTLNSTTNQPLQQEQAAFSAMLTGLSSTEQATAKQSVTYSDLVVGPQQDGNFPATPIGLKCANLSASEKALVLAAIKTYVYDIDDADAATLLAKYTAELDNTYLAYSGTTGMTTRNDYVRLDGPSLWLEYSCQNGIVLSPTHPHSVWRDKSKDYGGN